MFNDDDIKQISQQDAEEKPDQESDQQNQDEE